MQIEVAYFWRHTNTAWRLGGDLWVLNLDPFHSDSSGVSWVLHLLIQVHTACVVSVSGFQAEGQAGGSFFILFFS